MHQASLHSVILYLNLNSIHLTVFYLYVMMLAIKRGQINKLLNESNPCIASELRNRRKPMYVSELMNESNLQFVSESSQERKLVTKSEPGATRTP